MQSLKQMKDNVGHQSLQKKQAQTEGDWSMSEGQFTYMTENKDDRHRVRSHEELDFEW